ncbi:hypothetical protein HK099_004134 [Clydaea vesicula]|uniref:TECPR1-like DysF domain-containing protein n=1 Tax=Clydaea vesicula TaxID=447962 RepID=A0AAD5XYE0_9FUNG|nr:hypothetical protein HK099_004134 [Clydaea vesicula]
MTTLTLDLPELVSVCIPEVEHQYYGTYHFKQTENLSDIKSLNFNKLHNTTNFSKENYIQSSKVEQDIPRSEKLLEYVMKNDNQSLIQLLKETSSTTESETDCIDLNFTENSAGLLPIHYASSRGFLLVVKTLIEIGGADVNAVDKENESALYKASHNGHLEVMTYLISKGASVDIQDQEGWSSLHNCSSRGFKDCVELLLLKKCEIDVQSTTGFTPLSIKLLLGSLFYFSYNMNIVVVACSKGYSDITLILLRNNANPLLKNKVGEYAYDLASQNEHAYICDVLETAEKMKNDNQPITHSTFYELIYEYQCTTMFTSKFSNQNLSKPDKQTFTNKLNQPKAKSQVQLPSKDWFWLSDWKLDLNHPLVDPETGWQYSRNLEDQVWQKKLPNSSLFGGNVGAVYRRRRWIRIRKLRRDFFDAESELTDADYLITAQNMFKNFFKDEDFISNELELDESFQMSQNIIQVLLDGIKDDVDLRRKKSAINMANNLLEKAEQFKVALENREKIRKSKGKETEVLLSPTTLQKQRVYIFKLEAYHFIKKIKLSFMY